MRVLLPLLVPFIAVIVAMPAALLFFRIGRYGRLGRNRLLWATVLVAGVAALVPNSGQRMYDAGISLQLIDILEGASYFVFVFALTGAWTLVGPGWPRAALFLLVPIALFEPVRWTWALSIWSIWGFAP